MGAFNTKTILYGNPALIPAIADRICQIFTADGYQINREDLLSGGVDISVTKGGIFKAILGMKTALKISLVPQENSIYFQAGVGIFGQQAIPTIISMIFYWPVLITQIWGLVKQSKLDDKALAAAQAVISENGGNAYATVTTTPAPSSASGNSKYCTKCGTALAPAAHFCSNCGTPLS